MSAMAFARTRADILQPHNFRRSELTSCYHTSLSIRERRMKTYRYYFFAAIAFCSLPAQAASDQLPVLGQGNISCGSWLEGRQTESVDATSRVAWVLGFMTGFNQYGSKSKADDVSEGKSTEELLAWMDNYCRQHEGDNLHRASTAFIDEFQKRTGR
jgi:hypothetical protein